MLKFNNNNIFTGYLKQLLSSFNLPKYRIYTADQQRYHNWAEQQGPEVPKEKDIIETKENITDTSKNIWEALYLKEGNIQKYIDGQWILTDLHYHENKKELNQTKQLKITGNVYDSYTHEYLGDFLRFIRDYYDIDLMPLYNCFSNTLCPDLYLELASNTADTKSIFNTYDQNFKIYMLPVKLFKKYTIAIDSETPIELCCGLFGAYQDKRARLQNITNITYKKVNSSKFSQPFIFDKLTSENLSKANIEALELAQNENNLKLFIKLPANNTSSITILEGDYSGYNNTFYIKDDNYWKFISNKIITNYATENENEDKIKVALPSVSSRPFNPITNLQLLCLNTGTSYPFADRLIEYLVGNTITSEEDIADNIKRIQTVFAQNHIYSSVYGAWDNKMRNVIYDYINNCTPNITRIKHDLLGYVDKDAEKYFIGTDPITGKKVSISNVYIYPELYKEAQEDKGGNN